MSGTLLDGPINSAFCDAMSTTVTAAHHFIWRHLYASLQAAQTPGRVSSGLSASKLSFVTPDKESSMNTLWQQEEFEQIYSSVLGHRNWQIETASRNLAGFLHFSYKPASSDLGSFLMIYRNFSNIKSLKHQV